MKNTRCFALIVALSALFSVTHSLAQTSQKLTSLRGLRIGEICIAQRKALDALNAEGARPTDGVCERPSALGYTKIETQEREETIETGLDDDFRIYKVVSHIKWHLQYAPSLAGLKNSLIDRFGQPAIYQELSDSIELTWATEDSGKGQPADVTAPLKGCQRIRVNGTGTCPKAQLDAFLERFERRNSQLGGVITIAHIGIDGPQGLAITSMIRMFSKDALKEVEDNQKKRHEAATRSKDKRALPKF